MLLFVCLSVLEALGVRVPQVMGQLRFMEPSVSACQQLT